MPFSKREINFDLMIPKFYRESFVCQFLKECAWTRTQGSWLMRGRASRAEGDKISQKSFITDTPQYHASTDTLAHALTGFQKEAVTTEGRESDCTSHILRPLLQIFSTEGGHE